MQGTTNQKQSGLQLNTSPFVLCWYNLCLPGSKRKYRKENTKCLSDVASN